MNKADLINVVAEATEFSKKDTTLLVDTVFEKITDALVEGDNVKIFGFGNFEVRERAGRKGRNPSTGEPMEIPASKNPAFKPSKPLKEAVNK